MIYDFNYRLVNYIIALCIMGKISGVFLEELENVMNSLCLSLTAGSISVKRKLRCGGRIIRREYTQSTTSRELLLQLMEDQKIM